MSDKKKETAELSTLCLTLKKGEWVQLGPDIEVICKGRKPNSSGVMICFRAPRSLDIRRHKPAQAEEPSES